MPTTAEALAVALDHAEETGEYSPELLQRIADLLPTLRITTAWVVTETRWLGQPQYDLHSTHGRHLAEVVDSPSDCIARCAPTSWTPAWFSERDEAQKHCEDLLRKDGWTIPRAKEP